MHLGRKTLSLLVSLSLLLALLPLAAVPAAAADPVTYRKYNTETKQFEDACTETYTEVLNSTDTAWNGGWYVVESDVTIESRITVSGTVNLILCDGAKLVAKKGITVAGENKLNIYAGSTTETVNGSGCLYAGVNADGTIPSDNNYNTSDKCAGIGGADGQACGSINIYGGTISAKGGGSNGGAGIGGGSNGAGGNITIYGGTVTAKGGSYSAGIGGGHNGAGGTIKIYGGNLTAEGDNGGAGIGGGCYNVGGSIEIHGGNVIANNGGDSGAGIGAGNYCQGGTIEISGGNVTARATEYGAGIGGGSIDLTSGVKKIKTQSINISGGNVTAYSEGLGAAIGGGTRGGGELDYDFTVNISGGKVTAIAKVKPNGTLCGAGIGGGAGGKGVVVTISGGTVYAEGGMDSITGIGAGKKIYESDADLTSGTLKLGEGVALYGNRETEALQAITGYNASNVEAEKRTRRMFVTTPLRYLNREWNSTSSSVTENTVALNEAFHLVLPGTTTWTAGNYVAAFETAIDERIVATGAVKLFLCDGAALTAAQGITVSGAGNSLSIYGQAAGTGALTADSNFYAGIGGYDGAAAQGGDVTIHGGVVKAAGNSTGAGIGGGMNGSLTGSIIIYGGDVTASSGNSGAGIGGGISGSLTGSVIIYGGSVTASSGNIGAGIGSGSDGSLTGDVIIYGGSVTASSGNIGAGIGGGSLTGSVTVSGGDVKATSNTGVGIGGDSGGSVTVTGGSVTATGGYFNNGIRAGSVTVSGGSVTAAGGVFGNGIGAGTLTLGEGVTLWGGSSAADGFLAVGPQDYTRTRPQYMKTHIHSLTYSASGAVLTATCSADDCPLPEHKAVLTLTAPTDAVYNGSAHPAVMADYSVFNDTTGLSLSADSIVYEKKNGESWTYVTAADTADAGTYRASLTAESQTASVEYDIAAVPSVTVTVTGHKATAAWSGREVYVFGYDVTISDPLYTEADFDFSGVAEARRTDAGTTYMGLAADQFVNNNSNFYSVTFDVTDGFVQIAPAPAQEQPSYDDGGSAPAAKPVVQTFEPAMTFDGGKVAVSPEKAKEGDAVTLTATPEEGKVLWSLTAVRTDGKPLMMTSDALGSAKFTMPGCKVTVNAVFAAADAPMPPVVLSPQKITVNGVEATVEAYNIGGTNFFRLRDLAALLKGTPAQFDVDYDETANAVTLTKGKAYAGEVSTAFTDRSASAVPSPQTVYVDGAAVELTAFNIGGYNFFGLRELSALFGYAVGYDAATNAAIIESK